MGLATISTVSREMGVSARTLRYYEQIGLISSDRIAGYAYRAYGEAEVARVRQILVLRKLRIPLGQIAEILRSDDATEIIDAFQRSLSELDGEIAALSTVRDIVRAFIARLRESVGFAIESYILDDVALLDAVGALSVRKPPLREAGAASELRAASEKLGTLTDRDVRVVYLPPMEVASIRVVGRGADGSHAESLASSMIDEFIARANLREDYPEARSFGFNNPDGVDDGDPAHGYERWVSIPDGMEVPAPFLKKRLVGGTYAARMIPMGAWDEGWLPLHRWVENSRRYDFRWGTVDGVCGWLEEHLNYWDWDADNRYGDRNQFDLLLPVKRIT